MSNHLNIALLIVALVAAALAFLQYRAARRKPGLRVVVFPASPLVRIEGDQAAKVSVTYEGKKVEHLSVLKIEASNSGNVPLKSADCR